MDLQKLARETAGKIPISMDASYPFILTALETAVGERVAAYMAELSGADKVIGHLKSEREHWIAERDRLKLALEQARKDGEVIKTDYASLIKVVTDNYWKVCGQERIPYIKGQLDHSVNKAAYELWCVISNTYHAIGHTARQAEVKEI